MLKQQRLEEESIMALKKGHKQASGELIHLLSLNMQEKQRRTKRDYDFLLEMGIEFAWYEKEDIETVLNGYIIYEDESYKENKDNLRDVAWRVLAKEIEESENAFFSTPLEGVKKVKSMPRNSKSIDISNNGMGSHTLEEIKKILESLPSGLRILNIWGNRLRTYDAKELSEIMEVLPKKLGALDLGGNNLGSLGVERLKKLFQCLPDTLVRLKLRESRFNGRYCLEELQDIMQYLPRSLKTFYLGENGLSNYTKEDLGISEDVELIFKY